MILLAASASFITHAQSKLPADLDPQSRARLPYLKKSEIDAKGQKALDIFIGKDGTLTGPLAFAAYNSGVGQALLDLHNAAVTGGTLDPHTRELAILVACRETQLQRLEHLERASGQRSQGWNRRQGDRRRLRNNRPLTGLDEKDATVISFGRQLFGDKNVDSGTFAKAVELSGQAPVHRTWSPS